MKRVLVLRAREDAARTAGKLHALGYETDLSPVLEIAATGAPIPPGAYDAVLASSAKGVECAGAGAETFKRLPLHAVGAKTAKAAQERGWRPRIVAGSAEAILPLLLQLYVKPAHFLYLAGRDRQPALEAGLRAAGHDVSTVDVYEARAAEKLSDAARMAIARGRIDVALHYSRRSVEIFLTLCDAAHLTPRLGAVAHVALSPEVAKPLLAAGLEPYVARTPDESGVLKAATAILEELPDT